jgi:hypothetical protein
VKAGVLPAPIPIGPKSIAWDAESAEHYSFGQHATLQAPAWPIVTKCELCT